MHVRESLKAEYLNWTWVLIDTWTSTLKKKKMKP